MQNAKITELFYNINPFNMYIKPGTEVLVLSRAYSFQCPSLLAEASGWSSIGHPIGRYLFQSWYIS